MQYGRRDSNKDICAFSVQSRRFEQLPSWTCALGRLLLHNWTVSLNFEVTTLLKIICQRPSPFFDPGKVQEMERGQKWTAKGKPSTHEPFIHINFTVAATPGESYTWSSSFLHLAQFIQTVCAYLLSILYKTGRQHLFHNVDDTSITCSAVTHESRRHRARLSGWLDFGHMIGSEGLLTILIHGNNWQWILYVHEI